jgi:hypothetical protein
MKVALGVTLLYLDTLGHANLADSLYCYFDVL